MLLDISGNTFSSLGNPQDADAMAFISAAGISDTTQITAIDNLVKDLKTANIWTKMQVIYPVVGGTANSHKYNLKDPRNADAAFRLVFSGSWTHSSTGMKPTTANIANYAESYFNPSANTSLNSTHLSIYVRQSASTSMIPVGIITDTPFYFYQINASSSANGGNTILNGQATNFATVTGVTDSKGFWLGTRTTASLTSLYINGLPNTSSTASSSISPNAILTYGARRNLQTSSFDLPSNQEIAFSSIGSGLTASEVSAFNTIVEAYQTSLSRQVITSTTISRPTQATLPTVTYNPKQIYGNDLYVWVNMTDWRNMYNSQTGSTNIPSTGYVPATSATAPSNHTSVRRMEDMAGNFTGSNSSRKFYSISTLSDAIIPDSNVTGTSYFSNVFNNNQLDSNKGFFSGTSIESTNLRHVVNLTQPINFLATNSTLTICNYMYMSYGGTPVGNNYSLGITFPRFVTTPWLGFGGFSNSFNLSFYLPSSSTSNSVNMWSNNWPTSYTQYNNKTIMLTAVISGRGYDIYANNVLLTSGTIPTAVTYPFSAAGTTYQIGIGHQPAFGGFYQSSRPIWEGFIANSYTSPQQINLLYDYFRVKFKDRQGDLA